MLFQSELQCVRLFYNFINYYFIYYILFYFKIIFAFKSLIVKFLEFNYF